MSEKMTIELDVVATCLVCQLADGRVAVMHDTAKGEMGPKLHSIQDGGDAFIEAAVSEVLTAALQEPAPKKPSLKKDADAKDAIAAYLRSCNMTISQAGIAKKLRLTGPRLTRLLNEMCKEEPLRVGPVGDHDWTSVL